MELCVLILASVMAMRVTPNIITTANLTVSNSTTANPTVSNSTTANPTVSTNTSANTTVSTNTSANPTVSNSTTANPTVSTNTSANLTVSTNTTANPTVSTNTTANPTVSTNTSANPTVSNSTTANLTVSTNTSANLTVSTNTSANPTVSTNTSANPTVSTNTSANPTVSTNTSANLTVSNSTTANLTVSNSTTANPTVSTNTSARPTVSTNTSANPTVSTNTTANPTVSTNTSANPTVSTNTTANPTVSTSTTANLTVSTSTTANLTVSTSTTANTTVSTNTTANTTVANPTLPTVQCQNGGRETNGFCICPNDFTGISCELSNVCPEATINTLTFQKTFFGQAGYSKEVCSPGSVNVGLPKATAWCLNNLTFAAPQELNCSLTLDTINIDLSSASPKDRQILASNTQILTSRPENLTSQNISTAAKIVSSLLMIRNSSQLLDVQPEVCATGPVTQMTDDKYASHSLKNFRNNRKEVSHAAITTVSQLLNTSTEKFNSTPSDSIINLTKTLQDFALQIENGSAFVQPNIAIQTFNVSQSSEIQITDFSALTNDRNQRSSFENSGDSSDTFSANRIKINDKHKNISDQFPIDLQMNIKLKEVSEDTKIGFVLYNNDQFFRSQIFQPSLNIKRRVIAGRLGTDNGLESVEFIMRAQNVPSKGLHEFACVFWDYAKEDWSTKGCNKGQTLDYQTCKCEGTRNLANFAMLMSFSSSPEIIQDLNLISMIGCALSVVGLIITVIFQILTRKSRRSSPTILMVSICICMTIVYLVFIFGIRNSIPDSRIDASENLIPPSDVHQDPDSGACTALTALLQYFLLATFTWSSLYAAHIFLLIKNTFSGLPRYFRVLSIVVGWGLPAVVVGISLGITYHKSNPLNYRQEAICWLAALDENNTFDMMKPMLWGFLLPVAVMLLFNIAVLFYFSYTICRTNPDLNSSRVTPLRSKMLGCVSMSVVLGVSWVIGYFLLLEKNDIMSTVLSFAFCLCNTTQGIQIFVLFTVRTSTFKKKALAVFQLVPPPVLANHRRTFDVTDTAEPEPEESYRSTNFDLYYLYH